MSLFVLSAAKLSWKTSYKQALMDIFLHAISKNRLSSFLPTLLEHPV